MKKIVEVKYQPPLCTAYITVVGHSPEGAERNAKLLSTALRDKLPEDACIHTPREKGFDPRRKLYTFEVPAIIGACVKQAKSIISQMVLQGQLA